MKIAYLFSKMYFGILGFHFIVINFVIFVPFVNGYSFDTFFSWLPFWGIMCGGGIFGYFLFKTIG